MSSNRTKYQREYKRKWRSENRERYNQIQRDWWSSLKDKQKYSLRYRLKSRYGITVEQYEQMRIEQNEACAICLRHESEFKNRLAVDHNHKTGEVRALLCWTCNRHLVGKHTDPEMFRKAAEYLETKHTGWFVPPKKKKRKKKRGKWLDGR